jgi:hypothetical protein
LPKTFEIVLEAGLGEFLDAYPDDSWLPATPTARRRIHRRHRVGPGRSRTTAPAAGDQATAQSGVATVRITTIGLTIEVSSIAASATARCVAGAAGPVPAFSAQSRIAALKVNGVAIPVGAAPLTVPLLVGSLKLNTTTTTGTAITQRAFELRTLAGTVTLGEASAGTSGTSTHPTGTPCTA